MSLSWTTIDSPVGELLLVASPAGVVRIAFECEDFGGVRRDVEKRTGTKAGQGGLGQAEEQLAEYFAGQRREFDLPLDWRLSSGFRTQVQRALTGIAYGETQTYAQLAQRVGNPNAVRAVGSGCATNPLPIVVPCHRVLRSDGALGGYRGGLVAKRVLLDLESGQRD